MDTMNEQEKQAAAPVPPLPETAQEPSFNLNDLPEDVRKQAEEAYFSGHYPYLMQALVMAVSSCTVWRLADSDDIFTMMDVFRFAKQWDEEHPLKDGEFYMVSVEGAIGMSPGAEWLTKWLFIPMEDGPERDALLKDLDERMAQMAAEEEAAISSSVSLF